MGNTNSLFTDLVYVDDNGVTTFTQTPNMVFEACDIYMANYSGQAAYIHNYAATCSAAGLVFRNCSFDALPTGWCGNTNGISIAQWDNCVDNSAKMVITMPISMVKFDAQPYANDYCTMYGDCTQSLTQYGGHNTGTSFAVDPTCSAAAGYYTYPGGPWFGCAHEITFTSDTNEYATNVGFLETASGTYVKQLTLFYCADFTGSFDIQVGGDASATAATVLTNSSAGWQCMVLTGLPSSVSGSSYFTIKAIKTGGGFGTANGHLWYANVMYRLHPTLAGAYASIGHTINKNKATYVIGTAGTGGLSAGQVVYLSGNNTYLPAEANASSTMPAFGYVPAAISAGSTGIIQKSGPIYNASASWTANQFLYVDPANAGNMTTTEPTGSGQYIQECGIATTANNAWLDLPHAMVQHK